ncbi:hypothetical protein HaLaN_18252, partial [Haematococcus lacustris]
EEPGAGLGGPRGRLVGAGLARLLGHCSAAVRAALRQPVSQERKHRAGNGGARLSGAVRAATVHDAGESDKRGCECHSCRPLAGAVCCRVHEHPVK